MKKLFKTLIKKDHKLGDNLYVRGRISGIAAVMLKEPKIPLGHGDCEEGYIIPIKCSQRRYLKFVKVIEEQYPGLCQFNYKDKES